MTADAILSATPIHRGWLSLTMLRLRLNGIVSDRAIVEHPSGATVLAYDPVRGVAMTVRQTRDAVLFLGGVPLDEAVAGVTDPGEAADATALRELAEETGLVVRQVEPVAHVWMTPSSTTERVHLFLAEYRPADRVGAGGGMVEENERLALAERPLAELWDRAHGGALTDAKLFMLLQALRIRQPALFGRN